VVTVRGREFELHLSNFAHKPADPEKANV
jgi:hypothetical protein